MAAGANEIHKAAARASLSVGPDHYGLEPDALATFATTSVHRLDDESVKLDSLALSWGIVIGMELAVEVGIEAKYGNDRVGFALLSDDPLAVDTMNFYVEALRRSGAGAAEVTAAENALAQLVEFGAKQDEEVTDGVQSS